MSHDQDDAPESADRARRLRTFRTAADQPFLVLPHHDAGGEGEPKGADGAAAPDCSTDEHD